MLLFSHFGMELILGFFKKLSGCFVVFVQSAILEQKVINLTSEGFMLSHCQVSVRVTLQDLNLLFELAVFFVEEVHLVLKFVYRLFVLFMLEFKVELLKVLSGSEHLMQAQDFLVTYINLGLQFLGELSL